MILSISTLDMVKQVWRGPSMFSVARYVLVGNCDAGMTRSGVIG